MRISKLEYENYINWKKQRYKHLELNETPHRYKGGEIWVSGAPTKRAVEVKVRYKDVIFGKIFEVPCDATSYEEDTGWGLIKKIETKTHYTWRDAETFQIALEFGKGIIDGYEMLESKTGIQNYCFSCKPFEYEQKERNTAKKILEDIIETYHLRSYYPGNCVDSLGLWLKISKIAKDYGVDVGKNSHETMF